MWMLEVTLTVAAEALSAEEKQSRGHFALALACRQTAALARFRIAASEDDFAMPALLLLLTIDDKPACATN
jgi:hypothetical protein